MVKYYWQTNPLESSNTTRLEILFPSLGCSSFSARLDKKKAIRLIGDPSLTNRIAPLSHRHAVLDLSLFSRNFHSFCLTEIYSIVLQLARPDRETCLTDAAHQFAVELLTSKIDRYDRNFVPRVYGLWNSQRSRVFSDTPNLQCSKSRINKSLLHSL